MFFSNDLLDNCVKKHDYKIPSMSKISKIKKRFTVISTFSGGGGSSLGYTMAGGHVLVSNEFVSEARKTYKLNFPKTIVLKSDIRKLNGPIFLKKAKLKVGELDILDGSPPCASFSTMGARQKKWGTVSKYSNTEQRTDDLFFEFIRLAKEIQPKVVIAENVKGLLLGQAKQYLKRIKTGFENAGYVVSYKLLDSSNYGVPQKRERVIFVCVRKDLDVLPSHPVPTTLLKKVTMRDAISDLIGSKSEFTSYDHLIKQLPKRATYSDISNILCDGKTPSGFLISRTIRNKWNAPSRTIMQSTGSILPHPLEDRSLSIAELKRLQTFPDDFKLDGTPKQQLERIGRSVPPLMMKAIADHIYEKVLKNV